MADGRENRRSGRRKTLFGGVIYDEDRNAWECSVSDLSEEGVRIKITPEANLELGDFVDLKINKFNDLRRSKVMWARDGYTGLQFLVKVDRNEESMSGFFKLIDK